MTREVGGCPLRATGLGGRQLSRPLPRGRFVVAEVNGELVAAQPLAGGRAFADPFRPTAELLPLMRLRARQIAGADRRLGFLPRARSLVRE